MAWLDDLETLCMDTGMVSNEDLLISTRSQVDPKSPILRSGEAILSIAETTGFFPERTQNSVLRPAYIRPAAQLVARARSYAVAKTKAQVAYEAMSRGFDELGAPVPLRNFWIARSDGAGGYLFSGWYREIVPQQEPFDMGPDDSGLARCGFNVIAVRRPDPLSATTTYMGMVLGQGPLAFWPLNELGGLVAHDRTSNANHGSYVGDVVMTQNGIVSGMHAMAVAPPTQGMTVSWPAVLDYINKDNDYTAEVWFFKSGDLETDESIFQCSGSPLYDAPFSIAMLSTGQLVISRLANGLTTYTQFVTTESYNDGTWHLVSVRYRVAEVVVECVIDGSLVASGSMGEGWGDATGCTDVTLGLTLFEQNFTGSLSMAVIYPGAQSVENILARYLKCMG